MERGSDTDNEQLFDSERATSGLRMHGSGSPISSHLSIRGSEYSALSGNDDANSQAEESKEEVPEISDRGSEIDSCFEASLTQHTFTSEPDPFVEKTQKWCLVEPPEGFDDDVHTPAKKNHSTTLHDGKLYVFGGYDGKKNHNIITVFDIKTFKWSHLEIENAPSG
jgi:hypothetical protein